MKKIAFVVATSGLEYDDRIRKEALTLSGIGQVTIFAVLANNRESEGVTPYGIPYKAFRLKTRDTLPSAKWLLVKAMEFYWRVRRDLKGYDIVWVHDYEPFMFPLLLRNARIVWDLHEIPEPFTKNGVMKKVFQFIEKRCTQLIHANNYRIDYLIRENVIKIPEKHIAIRNFPDTRFEQSVLKDEKYDEFNKWVSDSEYIYLQGLQHEGRYPLQAIEAVMRLDGFKAVVVGNFQNEIRAKLSAMYGDTLFQKVYFRGKVDQLATPDYIKGSKFSIIVYSITEPNNRYCEPNRMYQSIVFQKPVIVGCNEPMSDLVLKYGFGVALKGDGSNVVEISEAIHTLLNKYEVFFENTKKNKEHIVWSKQEQALKAIVEYV